MGQELVLFFPAIRVLSGRTCFAAVPLELGRHDQITVVMLVERPPHMLAHQQKKHCRDLGNIEIHIFLILSCLQMLSACMHMCRWAKDTVSPF